MYNIVGSKVLLRPRKLARRRWFVRKYPLCVYIANKMAAPVSTSDLTTKASTKSEDSSGGGGVDSFSDLDDQEQLVSSTSTTNLNKFALKDAGPIKSASTSELHKIGAKIERKKQRITSSVRKKYKKIYLFARNNREKEQWFHRLKMVSGQFSYLSQEQENDGGDACATKSDGEAFEMKYSPQILDWILYTSVLKQFFNRMSSADVVEKPESLDSPNFYNNMQLNSQIWKSKDRLEAVNSVNKENIVWLNAVFTRIFMDCSKDPFWIKAIMDKIEMKLATIRLPYFIETLKLAKLDPGGTPPKITGIHQPTVNDWGLWLDLDIEYFGEFRLALETKVNLMKLKADSGSHHKMREDILSRYWDDEVPDSPESSEDEADRGSFFNKEQKLDANLKDKPKPSRTFMNLVDKITRSRYFQEATDNKYIKKLMQDVSETPFMLFVDLIYLEGTLAVNIPPPPSDRIWYGFRSPPKISIKAKPRVGDRSLSLSHVIEWIENRLLAVFEKNLVIPNMDDIVVPLMTGSPLLKKVNT